MGNSTGGALSRRRWKRCQETRKKASRKCQETTEEGTSFPALSSRDNYNPVNCHLIRWEPRLHGSLALRLNFKSPLSLRWLCLIHIGAFLPMEKVWISQSPEMSLWVPWQRMDCLSLPVCGILQTIMWHGRRLCHHPHLWRIRANWNPSAVAAIKARLLAEIGGRHHFSNYTSFTCQRKESLAKD